MAWAIIWFAGLQDAGERERRIEQALLLLRHDSEEAVRGERELIALEAREAVASLKGTPGLRDRVERIEATLDLFRLAPEIKKRWERNPSAYSGVGLDRRTWLGVLTNAFGEMTAENQKRMVRWSLENEGVRGEHFRRAEIAIPIARMCRRSAVEETEKNGDEIAAAQEHVRTWLRFYVEALDAEDAPIRKKAADLIPFIARLPAPDDYPQLSAWLVPKLKSSDAWVRRRAAETLESEEIARAMSPETASKAADPLRGIAGDGEPETRMMAIFCLRRLTILDVPSLARICDDLVPALQDADRRVSDSAACALGVLARRIHPTSSERIARALLDKMKRERDSEEMSDPEGVLSVVDLLEGELLEAATEEALRLAWMLSSGRYKGRWRSMSSQKVAQLLKGTGANPRLEGDSLKKVCRALKDLWGHKEFVSYPSGRDLEAAFVRVGSRLDRPLLVELVDTAMRSLESPELRSRAAYVLGGLAARLSADLRRRAVQGLENHDDDPEIHEALDRLRAEDP